MLGHDKHCHFHKLEVRLQCHWTYSVVFLLYLTRRDKSCLGSLILSKLYCFNDSLCPLWIDMLELLCGNLCIFVKMVNVARCTNHVSSLSFAILTTSLCDIGFLLIFACSFSNVSIYHLSLSSFVLVWLFVPVAMVFQLCIQLK